MARVTAEDGTVAVVVPGALEAQAAFKPFVELSARIAGPEAMSLLATYFMCGDLGELTALFASAGLRVTVSRKVGGTYTAPSVDAAVTNEVESTPLIERISEETYRRFARKPWRSCGRSPNRTAAWSPRSSASWWRPLADEPGCARLEAVSNGLCVTGGR